MGCVGAKGPGPCSDGVRYKAERSIFNAKKATISATYTESSFIAKMSPHVLDSCKMLVHILVKILKKLLQQL